MVNNRIFGLIKFELLFRHSFEIRMARLKSLISDRAGKFVALSLFHSGFDFEKIAWIKSKIDSSLKIFSR